MTHRNTATPITSFILMVCAVTLLFQPQASFAKGKEPILLGTSTALTGPANALGRSMVRGMQSHFKHINATNEIEGYSVELKALDDGYHKESAELQMGKLIEQHGVLAVLGNVGTPTATKTVPLANHHKVPLIGAFTGANVLRKPEPDRYIINYRASYDEEMAKVVNSLLDNDVNPDRIAFFTQKDSFGNAGYNGAVKALKSRGVKNTEKLARGYYEANTLHVKDGLMEIIGARPTPKAVIIVGTYGPSSKFIRMAHKILPDTLFINISFVGSHPLARELDGCCENVYVNQVVPPLDADLPAVHAFKESLNRFYPDQEVDPVSFEGYIVASIVTESLKKMKDKHDRELLINTLQSFNKLDIGIGQPLSFGPSDHQGSNNVWLTRIDGKDVVAANWNELR